MANITDYEFPMRSIWPERILPSHRNNNDFFDNNSFSHPNDAMQLTGPTTAPLSALAVVPPQSTIIHLRNTPITLDAVPTSDQPFYSKNRSNRNRHTQNISESRFGSGGSYSRSCRSDTATAYAVKSAQYPILIEMIAAPSAARRALRSWKKEKQGALGAPNALPPNSQNFTENTQRESTNSANAVGSSSRPQEDTENGIELQDMSNSNPHPRQTSREGDGILTAPPTTQSSSVILHRPLQKFELPPQYMTFSEPTLQRKKRGSHMSITCTLAKSYPNFHLQCEYLYLDKTEIVNSSQSDTRLSFATILTKENIWVVAMEQSGYNEMFIKGVVGEEEYARLDEAGSEPTEGYPISTETAAPVVKKIRVPDGYDLGGIWCKAVGFYEVRMFIPQKKF